MAEKTLILIPTRHELEILDPYFADLDQVESKLCGFGLVEATINAYRETQLAKPDTVLLTGVAGTYNADDFPVGESFCFRSVSQYGIGCQRDTFQLPGELGFETMPDSLTLQPFGEIPMADRLISVTGSGVFDQAQIRQAYPDAVAEDMEGYGFALGAISNQVPHISIVRAISNFVDEPFSQWSLDEALNQLGQTLRSCFESSTI